jgi:hypothetical protein
MNYYYEIADCVTLFGEDNKYWVQHDIPDKVHRAAFNLQAMQCSNRVWAETNDQIRFVKNRYEDLYDTCGYVHDIEEFFMIKLRAKALP